MALFSNLGSSAGRPDDTKLIDYLKSHQTWAKPLKSSFFVKTPPTAGQLRDGIKEHRRERRHRRRDSPRRVLATYGISSKVNEWLKKNL